MDVEIHQLAERLTVHFSLRKPLLGGCRELRVRRIKDRGMFDDMRYMRLPLRFIQNTGTSPKDNCDLIRFFFWHESNSQPVGQLIRHRLLALQRSDQAERYDGPIGYLIN